MIVRVIIDNPSSQTDMLFDYLCPVNEIVKVGMRVKVPFGQGNRPMLGIVLEVLDDSLYSGNVKEIISVLDDTPILSLEQIETAKFIKENAICPISHILNQMIPHAKRLKTVKYLKIIDGTKLDANLLEAFKGETLVKYTIRFNKYQKQINEAIKNGHLVITYDAVEKSAPKWQKLIGLDYDMLLSSSFLLKNPMRMSIVDYLRNENEFKTLDEIMDSTGCSEYLINKMVKIGFLKVKYVAVSRTKERLITNQKKDITHLNYLDQYIAKYRKNEKFLYLANNRTEEKAFLKMVIDENIRNGLNTLIVVPDVLRGYEVTSYLKKFGVNNIASLNASYSDGELLDYYEQIMANSYQVIVTSFAFSLWNYPSLGSIIILDQEHMNYRYEQSPRIDLNIVLDYLASLKKIKLIYHSYAPLLSTYTEAMLNHLVLLYTKQKVNNNIIVQDMLESLKHLESMVLSKTLIQKIQSTMNNNEATILLLNNRSYSKSVSCRSCSYTFKCPKCQIPLQLNKEKNELYCPCCYLKIPYEDHCPKCFSDKLALNGFGMEKVLEEVMRQIPNARCMILKDSNYEQLEEIMDLLSQKELDIVITSDVFSKAIEGADVSLVGVVDLDCLLNNPSYNANQMAYASLQHANQLVNGKDIVIQTKSPKHFVLKNFVVNDYDEYYFTEINNRKALKVEPFFEVNRILIKGDYQTVFKTANQIKKVILSEIKEDIYVIGPSYNYKERKVQLIIKHKNANIGLLYTKIYNHYQKTNTLVIFDRYSKIIS